MSAGFMCVGTHGVTQIDQDWINFVFAQKGTLTFNANSRPLYGYTAITVSYTGEAPILFIKTNTLYVYLVSVTRSGNTWTWGFCANGPNGEYVETATYYIFDKQPNVETHCGINIYDSTGRVTFNSDYKPLRIAAIVPLPAGTTVTQNLTAGQTYAGIIPAPVSSVVFSPGIGITGYNFQGFRFTNSGATFETVANPLSVPTDIAIVANVTGL